MMDGESKVTDNYAWLASDLKKRSDWVYELENSERDEIDRAIEHCASAGKPYLEMLPSDFPLPSLAPKLRRISTMLEDDLGIFLIRGLPIESRKEDEARLVTWGIGLHMGVALPQSETGSMIHDVRDRGEISK